MFADDEHTQQGLGLPDGRSIADTPLLLAYVRRAAGEAAPPSPPWQWATSAPAQASRRRT